MDDKSIKKRIHSVKSWLDKAEESYARDFDTKGNLQLLLAKAELQHLEENKDTVVLGKHPLRWVIGIGLCLGLGTMWFMQEQPFVVESLQNETSTMMMKEEEHTRKLTSAPLTGAPSEHTPQPIVSTLPEEVSDEGTIVTGGSSVQDTTAVINSKEVVPVASDEMSFSEKRNQTVDETVSNDSSKNDAFPVSTQREIVTTSTVDIVDVQAAVREGGRMLRHIN